MKISGDTFNINLSSLVSVSLNKFSTYLPNFTTNIHRTKELQSKGLAVLPTGYIHSSPCHATVQFSFTFMNATQGFAQCPAWTVCTMDSALCNELQWVLPQLSTLSADREREGVCESILGKLILYTGVLYSFLLQRLQWYHPTPPPLVRPAALDLYWINAKGVLIDRPWRPEAAAERERERRREGGAQKYFCTFLWPTTMLSCKWPRVNGQEWSREENWIKRSSATFRCCPVPDTSCVQRSTWTVMKCLQQPIAVA